MATNTGQGSSAAPTYPANSCNSVTVYTGSGCSPIVVGCTLYYDSAKTITMPAGSYKVDIANNNKQVYTVNASGVVTAVTQCSWTSSYTYAPLFTGTKNNCVAGSCSVIGSTVNLNDGNPANAYSGYASYTSYISQADADSNAQQQAIAQFESTKQAAVNSRGFCTWTYSSGSGTCSQTFSRNNCGANCSSNGTIEYGNTQSGYTSSSTTSCQAAIDAANTAAYNAACAVVAANGQNHANNNLGCCCWNLEYYCSGCQRRSRERNSCDNSLRNDTLVENSTCTCGNTCGGTSWFYYCSGTTRMRELRNNCDNSYAGTTETFATCSSECGASTAPTYTSQGYTTCVSCFAAPVFRDTNPCSSTFNGYYYENQAGNKVYVGTQPSGTPCNTNSNCVDTGSGYCSGPNYVINQTQANSCSGASCGVRVIETNSVTYGCYTPPPSCFTYNIIRVTTTGNVTGNYTTCSGGASTFNFTRAEGSTGFVGSVCARQGTVSITSGNGQVQTGSSCSV